MRYFGFLVILGCVTARIAHGTSCTTPDPCDPIKSVELLSTVSATRTTAIRSCLSALATPFPPGTKLYTYGHQDKIETMRKMGKDEFWAFQKGFQLRREERNILKNAVHNDPAIIAEAKQVAAQHYDLKALSDAYLAIKAKGTVSEKEIITFKLAAYSKIYPELLDHLGTEASKLEVRLADLDGKPVITPEIQMQIQTLRKQLKDIYNKQIKNSDPDPAAISKLKGESLATQVNPGFDSTAGVGIYLSSNPTQSLDHLPQGGLGLVCQVSPTKNQLNLDDWCVRKALVSAKVLIPESESDAGAGNIVRPQGKNLFYSPQNFEKAAEGLAVAFRPGKLAKLSGSEPPYVVDKNVFAFNKKGGECAMITLSDFKDCDQFQKLLSYNSFPRFIIENDPGFYREFKEISKNCMNQCAPGSGKDTFQALLKNLSKENSPLTEFFQDRTSKLNKVLNECGCELKRESRLKRFSSRGNTELEMTCRIASDSTSPAECAASSVSVISKSISSLWSDLEAVSEVAK